MRHRFLLIGGMAVFLLGIVSASAAAAPTDPPKSEAIPPFLEVRQVVLQYFQANPDFQLGDLITREEVAPLLAQFQRTWLSAADAGKILEVVPAKGEFFVTQLSTPDGRKFMRRISDYPNVYDRLDRLSRMRFGRQTVSALIRGPGGEKMIDTMTRTSGGKRLGNQIANTPDDRDFNAPTGRIYTVTMLLAQLQQRHTVAVKAADGTGNK